MSAITVAEPGFTWVPRTVNLMGSDVNTHFMVPDEEAGQEELEETSGENKNKDMFIHKDIYLEDLSLIHI